MLDVIHRVRKSWYTMSNAQIVDENHTAFSNLSRFADAQEEGRLVLHESFRSNEPVSSLKPAVASVALEVKWACWFETVYTFSLIQIDSSLQIGKQNWTKQWGKYRPCESQTWSHLSNRQNLLMLSEGDLITILWNVRMFLCSRSLLMWSTRP